MNFYNLGELVLLNNNTLCSSNSVVYECTNSQSTFLNWELVTTTGSSSFVGLNSQRHVAGTTLMDQVGSSSIEYRVIIANISYIKAVVIIQNPNVVNGTRVTCNGDTHTLILKNPGEIKV